MDPIPAPVAVEGSTPSHRMAAQPVGTANRAGSLPLRVSESLGSTEASPVAAPAPGISLDEETAVLGEVQRSLTQRDGARALVLLDQLASRHPEGVLREERLAAQVFALCAAGRVEEAREAGKRFVVEMPASVQVVRVRASCAFSPTTSK